MIFVTVGTHEQAFDRLIECVDLLKADNVFDDEVIMQIGFSNYKPQYCEWKKLFTYDEIINYVKDARIIITHGGPASFIMPLQFGKIPIVVPRQKKFNEHVNNHQLDFSKIVAEKAKNILVIEDIKDLEDVIVNFNVITKNMISSVDSNNVVFVDGFKKIVNNLFNGV